MHRALLAAALALPALFSLPAAAQTKWDMATAYADTEFQTKNVRQFAEEVQKASGGKYAGDPIAALPALRSGANPKSRILSSFSVEKAKLAGLISPCRT